MESFEIKEEQLHFIWKYGLLQGNLTTSCGKEVEIKERGNHNIYDGPDFLDAQIKIGGQLWSGNVEIHKNASDWEKHKHTTQENYKNIILHIVYQEDKDIDVLKNRNIPTLEIKNHIPEYFFVKYASMYHQSKNDIACKDLFNSVDGSAKESWLEYLFIDRMEQKHKQTKELVEKNKGDWEKVFFIKLAEAYGAKANKEAFFDLAQSIPIKLLKKYHGKPTEMEALFLGQAGLLDREIEMDAYGKQQQLTYRHLRNLHNLTPIKASQLKWARIRPANFPSIRLMQLASVYASYQNIFSQINQAEKIQDIQNIFLSPVPSSYWESHYDIGKKSSRKSKRTIGETTLMQTILINTIIPTRFAYRLDYGYKPAEDELFLAMGISPEKNSIVEKFNFLKFKSKHAVHTQALLQLYQLYCKEKKCLNCRIGQKILSYG